jgi:hypothetical protein
MLRSQPPGYFSVLVWAAPAITHEGVAVRIHAGSVSPAAGAPDGFGYFYPEVYHVESAREPEPFWAHPSLGLSIKADVVFGTGWGPVNASHTERARWRSKRWEPARRAMDAMAARNGAPGGLILASSTPWPRPVDSLFSWHISNQWPRKSDGVLSALARYRTAGKLDARIAHHTIFDRSFVDWIAWLEESAPEPIQSAMGLSAVRSRVCAYDVIALFDDEAAPFYALNYTDRLLVQKALSDWRHAVHKKTTQRLGPVEIFALAAYQEASLGKGKDKGASAAIEAAKQRAREKKKRRS